MNDMKKLKDIIYKKDRVLNDAVNNGESFDLNMLNEIGEIIREEKELLDKLNNKN